MEKREPICACDVCGKELFEGDKAYGTSAGKISHDWDGFEPDGEGLITVACEECGEKISDAVSTIEAEMKKRGGSIE